MRSTSVTFALLLCLSSSAWSDGFYIGAGLGPEVTSLNTNTNTVSPGAFNVNNHSRKAATGLFGTIFGGYAWHYHAYFMAGEVNFNASNVKTTAYNNEFINQNFSHTDERMRHSYGLSVLPGYLISPATLLFTRLGYVQSIYSTSTNDPTFTNMSKHLSGIRFGLGVNQTLNEKVTMRMEYSQAHYQDTATTVVDGAVTKNTNITPTTGLVEFSLLYKL